MAMEIFDEIVFRFNEPTLKMIFQNVSNESASDIAEIPIAREYDSTPPKNSDALLNEVRTVAYNRWIKWQGQPRHRWVEEPLADDNAPQLNIRKETAESLIYCLNNNLLSKGAEAMITPIWTELKEAAKNE